MAETLSQTDLTFQRVSYFDGSIMLPKDDQENFLAQFLTGIFSLVLLDRCLIHAGNSLLINSLPMFCRMMFIRIRD